MKFFKKYVKGNLSSNNLEKQNIDDSLEDKSRETEDQMFSKSYWFDNNEDNNEQPAPDPWLPQMVRLFLHIIFSILDYSIYN